MFGILKSIDVSASGMTVQRMKMNAVSENIANAETSRTKSGGPYRRKSVSISQFKDHLAQTGYTSRSNNKSDVNMIQGKEIEIKDDNFRIVHSPGHPDADEDGFVEMPNIDVVTEMVDMMAASRAYEANTIAIATAKEMARNALDI